MNNLNNKSSYVRKSEVSLFNYGGGGCRVNILTRGGVKTPKIISSSRQSAFFKQRSCFYTPLCVCQIIGLLVGWPLACCALKGKHSKRYEMNRNSNVYPHLLLSQFVPQMASFHFKELFLTFRLLHDKIGHRKKFYLKQTSFL